jgi:hypothetical protein
VTDRAAYAAVADRIERELRELGAWSPADGDPGPPQGAFGGPYQSATQWIQFTLLAKVRDIAAGGSEPPPHSDAGVMAVREFDGWDAADALVAAVLALDDLVNYGEVAGGSDAAGA